MAFVTCAALESRAAIIKERSNPTLDLSEAHLFFCGCGQCCNTGWRTDRALRRLQALLAVADAQNTLLISGTGDVIQPTDGILGVGSGGNYAVAAARALVRHTDISASEIVRTALGIAAELDIYTNHQITVEELA